MDFSFTEEQREVRDLAARIFEGQATVERVKEVEASADRVDRHLWSELAKAGLLGLVLPEAHGGNGFGITELCLLLEQQGRRVAPIPLLWTLTAAMAIAEYGAPSQQAAWLPGVIAGDVFLTVALGEAGAGDPFAPGVTATPAGEGWRLEGFKPGVPAAPVAARVLVPARTGEGELGLFLVDPAAPGFRAQTAETTNRERHAHLELDGVVVTADDVLGDAHRGRPALGWLLDRVLVGLSAVQVGVAEEAIAQAAAYTSNRTQFGRPLSTFQGAALKAADAYIDTEAMRATMWQAAWRLTEGGDASAEVEVAKWWAAEGGHRVVHVTQHLHGGMGADVDYPIHRYFLWGKQIENTLGGASAHLSRLGAAIADAARRGEPVGVGA